MPKFKGEKGVIEAQQENFISVIDVVRIFLRRKKLFIVFFGVFITLSAIKIILDPIPYNYIQQINLAHYFSAGQMQMVLPLKQELNRIESYSLPGYINQYNLKNKNAKVNAKSSKYTLEANVSGSVLTLKMKAPKQKKYEQFFVNINKAVFNELNGVESFYLASLKNSTQENNRILEEEIPALHHLQMLQSPLNRMEKHKEVTDLEALRDIYISSLGSSSQYEVLYHLKKLYATNKETLSSLSTSTISKMIIVPDLTQVSLLIRLVTSIFVSLFLAALLLLAVNYMIFLKENIND